MKIGVISDTHDHFDNVELAFDELENQGVDLVCHLGDWVSPVIFNLVNERAQKLNIPVKGVLGNNDGEIYKIITRSKDDWKIELEHHTLCFEADDKSIVMYHGTDQRITEALIQSSLYNVVLSGHTHVQQYKIIENILTLNPGTLSGISKGRKIGEGQLAVYDSVKNKAELLTFSLT